MAGEVMHGREGILYVSTSSGSTSYGNELGYVESFTIDADIDNTEVTRINSESREYKKGLIGSNASLEGHWRIGDTMLHHLVNQFMKLEIDDTSDTSRTAISDNNLYFHGILRPIDTAKSSDAARGAKVVAELLPGNFSLNVGSGDLEGWSYGGPVDGDLLYVESTSTGRGIPKKA